MPKHPNAPDSPASPPSRPSYVLPVLAALLLLVGLGGWLWVQGGKPYVPTRGPGPSLADQGPAQMVDEQQCGTCHAPQAKAWKGSHHQLAMQDASPRSVQGDFDDARFEAEGESTRFFRKDDGYWVNTPGPDGHPADFKVAYAFGVEPLQQYLLELPGGRLQAFGIAWDTQKKAWFHLASSQGIDFRNPQHWSKPSQNANFQCIDCHSTGYVRGYDDATGTYASHWAAPGVGCQACHGPASLHLEWARFKGLHSQAGFTLDLARTSNRLQVETCARCHARRVPLDGDHAFGKRLMDDYLPSALTRELYELDGKFKEQVYEYGSFTQSRMYARGLSCSTCHDPHSGGVRVEGNGLCTQCHNPSGKSTVAGIDDKGLKARDYEAPEHLHHAAGQPGSQCVDCHMPGKTLLGNDYRHDHGFSLPNPSRALKLGTPDACLGCHKDVAGQAVAEQFEHWYAQGKDPAPRYDESLALIRNGRPGASRALFQQLERGDLPAIRRATLLAELPGYPSERALNLAANDLNHAAPQVREAAVRAVNALLPPEQRRDLLAPLLTDPVRAVRIIAARDLLGMGSTGLGNYEKAWDKAIAEYEAVQLSLAERAEANLNLASLYQGNGRADQVEGRLRTAIERDPDFLPARVALVQWLDANYRWEEGQKVLAEALREHPEAALLHHAQGQAALRKGERQAAIAAFREAVRLEPGNARYGHALAAALHDDGKLEEACRRLELVLESNPVNREARLALIGYWREAGQIQKVQALLAELEQLNPDDPALKRE